ncbi:MAG: 50S ribosomal protein L10 [Candidatus Omnitrophota bacterium]
MAHFEKELILKEVTKVLEGASSLFVTNFSKLNAQDMNTLRRKLENNATRLIITKNSLLKIAISKTELDKISGFVKGSTGIAVCRKDPIPVTKALFEFAKSHEGFIIRGGIIDGEVVDDRTAKQMSELPSKDVLRAMVLMRMNAPIAGFVNVLSASLRGIVVVLDKISQQKNAN